MNANFCGLTTLLQVFDMPRTLGFYRDLLGFEIVCTSPGDDFTWAMLGRGDCTLMLNTAYDEGERPAEPDAARVAAHGDTVLYFACDSVDEIHAYLRANRWERDNPLSAYYGMRQVYTKDPDGYAVCFQHPLSGGRRSRRGRGEDLAHSATELAPAASGGLAPPGLAGEPEWLAV